MAEATSDREQAELIAALKDLERRVTLLERHLADVAFSTGVPRPRE
jgi:hypothetical protein